MAGENNSELAQPQGFDLRKFAVDDQTATITLERKIVVVPVRRPDKQKFFKCAVFEPFVADVLELKEDNEYYLVGGDARAALVGETKRVKLYVCYYLNGTVFLCPVPQPDEKGKWNSWHKSLSEVIVLAKEHWIRAVPDKGLGGYTPIVATGQFVEPTIKHLDLSEYIEIAFKDKLITDPDHPVIIQLAGLG